jgi:hypothetical protein|tara:strand:- start:451 stop:645 length:195 start_codon:yes stop_codon:yes gene_type:complete
LQVKAVNVGDKNLIDWSAMLISAGALFEFLPAVASLLSVIWLLLRIWESETVQRALGRPDKEGD